MSNLMHRTRGLVMLLMTLLGTAQTAMAQSRTNSKERQSSDVGQSVNGASQVRLQDAFERVYLVREPTVVGDRLTGIRASDGTIVDLPIEEVTRIQRRGSAVWTGAKIGGAIGFVGGAVALGAYASSAGGEVGEATLIGGLAGGLVGVALGAAIAAPFRRWTTTYRAPRVTPVITGQMAGFQLQF